MCLKIRNFLRQNPQFDLRHVIDSVRYSTVELWQNFDEKNKKLFTENSSFIELDELRTQDIDNEIDWKLAELKYELLQHT